MDRRFSNRVVRQKDYSVADVFALCACRLSIAPVGEATQFGRELKKREPPAVAAGPSTRGILISGYFNANAASGAVSRGATGVSRRAHLAAEVQCFCRLSENVFYYLPRAICGRNSV